MRCPLCGSKMIYPYDNHKSFSGGKAVAGAVMFGVVGAAAGFIGKDIKGYKCSACGAFSENTMDMTTELSIDRAVRIAKDNNDFTSYNIFKETYQNIETISPNSSNNSIDIADNNLLHNVLQTTQEDETTIKNAYKSNRYICECPIFVEEVIIKTKNGKDLLSFAAWNHSEKQLRAAYFSVKVLDDAGDFITETNCVYQGMNVAPHSPLPFETEFPLETNTAYKIDFICTKAVFTDDSVWRYNEEKSYELEQPNAVTAENFQKYKALKEKIKSVCGYEGTLYQPVFEEKYVQCVCGYPFNSDGVCSHCKMTAEKIAEAISFENLEAFEKEVITKIAKVRFKKTNDLYQNALNEGYELAISYKEYEDKPFLKDAIEIFEKIITFKDSKQQIEICKKMLKEIEATEEAERLEAERIAEEERLEKERQAELEREKAIKKAKRKKKITISFLTLVCLTIAFVIALNTLIIPNGKYTDAIALMDEGKYSDAIAIFEEIDWYKDSDVKIEKSKTAILNEKYTNALSFMKKGKLDKAYNLFIELNDYKDSNKMVSKVRLLKSKKSMKNIKVGSFIKFGMYEQDNNIENGKEYIDWLVLEIKNNKAFVISKYLLDEQYYHSEQKPVTWKTCTLRKWLNNDFLNAAFTTEEKKIIPTVTVSADKNPLYNTDQGKATSDKVFLLSFTEAVKYIPVIEKAGDTSATQYAISNADYIDSKNPDYWLRTLGESSEQAVFINNNYYIYKDNDYNDPDLAKYGIYYSREENILQSYESMQNGSVVNNDIPVRPAMWIDLSKLK